MNIFLLFQNHQQQTYVTKHDLELLHKKIIATEYAYTEIFASNWRFFSFVLVFLSSFFVCVCVCRCLIDELNVNMSILIFLENIVDKS